MGNRKFIVFGMGNGGLFLARQLRKAYPESRIVGVGARHDIGKKSRALSKFIPADSAEDVLRAVQSACHWLQVGEIDAFIASNPMLEWLSGPCVEVFDRLHFENPAHVYRQFADKESIRALCGKCGVRQPEIYPSDKVRFPAVVKPLEKMKTLGLEKCRYVDTPSALDAYWKKMGKLGLRAEDVVIQQCIRGDNRWEYGYGGYFQEGKPLVDICFYQLRQLPQGLCCFVQEIADDALKEALKGFVVPILEETRMNGFLQFDIKRDSETGALFMLDMNPRPWKSSDMLSVKLGTSTVFHPVPTGRNVSWRIPFADWRSGKNPKNPPRDYCPPEARNTRYKRMTAVFSIKDLRPYMASLREDAGKIADSLRRRI